jgi:hypothetical protein
MQNRGVYLRSGRRFRRFGRGRRCRRCRRRRGLWGAGHTTGRQHSGGRFFLLFAAAALARANAGTHFVAGGRGSGELLADGGHFIFEAFEFRLQRFDLLFVAGHFATAQRNTHRTASAHTHTHIGTRKQC